MSEYLAMRVGASEGYCTMIDGCSFLDTIDCLSLYFRRMNTSSRNDQVSGIGQHKKTWQLV